MPQKLKHSTADIGRSFVQLLSENISKNGADYFSKTFSGPFEPHVDHATAAVELYYGVLANLFRALPNVFDKNLAEEIEFHAKADVTARTGDGRAVEIIEAHQRAMRTARDEETALEQSFALDEAIARSILKRWKVPGPHQPFEIMLITAALTDFAPNLRIIAQRIVI